MSAAEPSQGAGLLEGVGAAHAVASLRVCI
ncbi:hypothetical protein J2X19_004091 [Rhodoferax ferrireducens]|uniref:Uncharacterized protein n=1 Tax=Rhodoferax ferrireducens TaxID=192843 RepID=A0ABU2CDW4_9BURK|nr:hypothetical protein [Rhodoferax ferrireducens]